MYRFNWMNMSKSKTKRKLFTVEGILLDNWLFYIKLWGLHQSSVLANARFFAYQAMYFEKVSKKSLKGLLSQIRFSLKESSYLLTLQLNKKTS